MKKVAFHGRTDRPDPQRGGGRGEGIETCRKQGIDEATYYQWKTKSAGLEVSQLRHLKDVEAELARLKRMFRRQS